jgi:hypothetical protein
MKRYAISPISVGSITKGKKYKVSGWKYSNTTIGHYFTITKDNGFVAYCLEKGCAHINDNNWKIIEE